MNPHEQASRMEKALRLIDAFTDHLTAAYRGRTFTDAILYDYARRAPRPLWNELADGLGIKPPSDETVAVVLAALEHRAKGDRVASHG